MSDAISPQSLTFDSLVPGQWVHRRQLADVLVTDAQEIGPNLFRCGVQWPRHHFLLGRQGLDDTALIAETIRQTTTYIAHILSGVPLGSQFLMGRLATERLRGPLVGAFEANFVVSVRFAQPRETKVGLTSWISEVDLFDSSGLFATGSAAARILPRLAYERARSSSLASASPVSVRPRRRLRVGRVGVVEKRLSILAATRSINAFRVIVDPTETAFFDHDLDHVPGMLLLEAMRQAVRAVTGVPSLEVRSVDMEFPHFTEIGAPLTLTVTGGGTLFEAVFRQDGVATAVAQVATDEVALRGERGPAAPRSRSRGPLAAGRA